MTWRGPDSRDAQALEVPIEVAAIAGVSVMGQVCRLATPWRRCQELLPDPSRGGVGSNAEMHEFTALVPYEEEDVQSSKAKVCTTNRSAAQMPLSLLFRKVRQL